jgi:folate-binding protein YgfZ
MTDTTQLDAILHGAAFAPITDRAFLRITGPDATRWLNGMVTNNIKDLAPGEGNYNFLLNNQGRIMGDCTIYREPATEEPEYLLETDTSQIDAIHQLLDKFIIMDDVDLAPLNPLAGILVTGPQALSIVTALGTTNQQAAPCSPDAQAPAPQTINLKQTVYAGAPVSLMLAHSPLVPRLEIWSDPDTIGSILHELGGTNAVQVSPETLEAYRIYSGTPKYGIDIRNTETAKDLPQETAQTHALHFSKGCYLGQEIVERIHSRGQVHRTFAQFQLTGSLPTLPAPLESNGKSVGELTSATNINDTILALGYARREALDTNQPLTYPGGSANPLANWKAGKLETES